MDVDQVIEWLHSAASQEERVSLARYGIPRERALGIPMRELKARAKTIGRSHDLAAQLWDTGLYEARTLAAFIDDPDEVTSDQMDDWVHDFDSWAICDTVCFHLFDRTASAWDKVGTWSNAEGEFIRRAAFALLWALALHDRDAPDERFRDALEVVERSRPDDRPLVNKSADMALRAIARRSPALQQATMETAERMARSQDRGPAWIGKHTLRELTKQSPTVSKSG